MVVCDNAAGRLQVFARDGSYLASFPVSGWRREAFSEPSVAVAGDGLVWVTVPLDGELRLYGPEGKLLRSVRDSAPAHPLRRPAGVAMAPGEGALVVSDIEDGLTVVPLGKASLPAPAVGRTAPKR